MRYVLALLLAFSTMCFGQVATNGPAGTTALRQAGASPTAVTFGDSHFNVPAGWRYGEKQSGATRFLLMVPPDITEKNKFSILLLSGQDLPALDFPQTFDRILKQGLASNEHLIKYDESPAHKIAASGNIAGYDLLTRSMVVADGVGHQSMRICFGANPRNRLQMLIVSADSQETLKRYEPDVAVVLSSWSFGDASVPSGLSRQASGAARPAANPERGSAANSSEAQAGTRSQIAEGRSVLLCTDPAQFDTAMDLAKYGSSSAALKVLSHDAFFNVMGPARLEVKAFDLKSRWPKALVKVLDGDSAGRTAWVILSELKDIKPPAGK